MFFGNEKTFAIQVDIIERIGNELYCYFCYWINGSKIGDDSMLTSLNDILLFYPWIINDIGNRTYDSTMAGVEPKDIFDSIRSRIYDDETELYLGNPARFDIMIKTESMLGNDTYYIEDKEHGYIIYRCNNDIKSFEIEKEYVDKVFTDSYQVLYNLLEC